MLAIEKTGFFVKEKKKQQSCEDSSANMLEGFSFQEANM